MADKIGEAAEKLSKAIEARVMNALNNAGRVINDDTSAGLVEDAIVAALADFDAEHPLRITVTADDPSDDDKRQGFMRCTLRTSRPSLVESDDPDITPTGSTCGHLCYRKRTVPDASCWSCQFCPAERK